MLHLRDLQPGMVIHFHEAGDSRQLPWIVLAGPGKVKADELIAIYKDALEAIRAGAKEAGEIADSAIMTGENSRLVLRAYRSFRRGVVINNFEDLLKPWNYIQRRSLTINLLRLANMVGVAGESEAFDIRLIANLHYQPI